MITQDNKPKNYTPLDILKICSNIISDGGHLVAIGDVLPILIGKGEKPKVWLQAIADAKSNTFVSIVEESISKHPNVKVFENDGYLTIMVAEKVVLGVKMTGDNTANIDKLDFRPIGLNMYGDSESLNIDDSSFSGNFMSGGGTLIGFAV